MKASYGTASILKDGRVAFNICGNKYRLVVWINYMKPKVIETESHYEETLACIEKIFDAKPGTAKGDELEVLLLLVEKCEESAFPIDLPDPISAIRFRMEQEQLKPKDLVPYIGSRSKVSEVLRGQRPLNLTMIRNLVAGLGIPAEVLLQKSPAKVQPAAV